MICLQLQLVDIGKLSMCDARFVNVQDIYDTFFKEMSIKIKTK